MNQINNRPCGKLFKVNRKRSSHVNTVEAYKHLFQQADHALELLKNRQQPKSVWKR